MTLLKVAEIFEPVHADSTEDNSTRSIQPLSIAGDEPEDREVKDQQAGPQQLIQFSLGKRTKKFVNFVLTQVGGASAFRLADDEICRLSLS